MKKLKKIAVILLMTLISGLGGYYYLISESPFTMAIPLLIGGFFIFNLIIRKSLAFKEYFTSEYNFFTAKARMEQSYDISKELMFEKIKEVIDESDFKLVEADKDKFEILAISRITFKSWGENLYISFETRGNETIMKFCSSTLFQVSSWGKNEKNYEALLNEIETSLTV